MVPCRSCVLQGLRSHRNPEAKKPRIEADRRARGQRGGRTAGGRRDDVLGPASRARRRSYAHETHARGERASVLERDGRPGHRAPGRRKRSQAPLVSARSRGRRLADPGAPGIDGTHVHRPRKLEPKGARNGRSAPIPSRRAGESKAHGHVHATRVRGTWQDCEDSTNEHPNREPHARRARQADKQTSKRHPLHTNVVWVREKGRVPEGEERIEWLLLTNHPITTLEDACLVVFGYTQRWRIEEFHRTWKQGGCNVEATQLQTSEHVKRWATLLAAVAMRIERLKYLSRNQPDLPATEELSRYEIDALILKRRKRKNPGIPDGILTIGIATQWIAELGGYTGKSSGGPPGSITIGRGLERLAPVAETLQQLDEAGLLR
ncbi:transposase [Polyangium spumosum]|uniref:Transposase n=1 Tax=Polyangium spumosum TaxID=889282 RepID=A0A6N7PWS7_9BACT|nr:transposase [Polyangium spumosum]